MKNEIYQFDSVPNLALFYLGLIYAHVMGLVTAIWYQNYLMQNKSLSAKSIVHLIVKTTAEIYWFKKTNKKKKAYGKSFLRYWRENSVLKQKNLMTCEKNIFSYNYK